MDQLDTSETEDWFEMSPTEDAPLVRFVERRQGGRRGVDRRIEALSAEQATSPKVSLVIPTMNEARNITAVLQRLPSMVDEVVLVDGRSVDVTKLMATTSRPNIRIVDEFAPGKGVALRAGLMAATGDIIVAMDADGSM